MITLVYFLAVSYVLLCISLLSIFKKAGVNKWLALIPGYNFVIWSELIGRPKWWASLLLLPIVNIFVFTAMAVHLARSFQKLKLWHSILSVVYAPGMFFWIGSDPNAKYEGPILIREKAYQQSIEAAQKEGKFNKVRRLINNNPYKKTVLREWFEAIVFAVFAAALIRMFTLEAYAIPTSSMEGSLNVGDYLFVSKMHYGIRTPQTIAMIPLLHNRIPILNIESYWEKPQLPYFRLPGITNIQRNKPVVFNHPEGDSIYITPGRTYSINDYRKQLVPNEVYNKIQTGSIPLVSRPMDKMDHYVKHCIGLPGDSLQIIDRQVYIDGVPVKNPQNIQFRYLVKFNQPVYEKKLSEWGISKEDREYMNGQGPNHAMMILSQKQKELLKKVDPNVEFIHNDMYWVTLPPQFPRNSLLKWGIDDSNVRGSNSSNRLLLTLTPTQVDSLEYSNLPLEVKAYDESDRLFPNDPINFSGWTVDNYGPIWVPKAGETVQLNDCNINLYKRIITLYEGNSFRHKNGQFLVNGVPTNEYTFKYNYYWMMGDNRNNSEDSRVWGFVPETHIVGKPLFLFFSTKENSIIKGINWDRIFTSATKG